MFVEIDIKSRIFFALFSPCVTCSLQKNRGTNWGREKWEGLQPLGIPLPVSIPGGGIKIKAQAVSYFTCERTRLQWGKLHHNVRASLIRPKT
jgi:hypothetical protein